MHRVICALLAASASCATAQEAVFLTPAEGSVALGEVVEFSAAAGEERLAWPTERVEHFFARTAWTQENRDTLAAGKTDRADKTPAPLGRDSGTTIAAWPAELPGVLMLGCDFAPRFERVSAESFRAFVDRVLPVSRRTALGSIPSEGEVTLRRVESAKALVEVEAAGERPVSIATSKTGQVVEIRLLMDPMHAEVGSDIAVRVYSEIPGPKEGVVIATNTTTGEVMRVLTNDSATANITVSAAGRWRVEFHAVVLEESGDADWAVHTATVTFDVAGASDGEVTK
ncbi:hypothetical protein MNBD_PLANCTO03-2146 [hydrothermal vent metagenome]|uniref:Uncharacterized protein n=1 Tax=hydrothermal vent metagenome TaxID=652676 RepID=A0A3B1DTI7_9ZZZZ